ncbi:unnamed protein product [Allacma fusca]|uniref:Uncharacterized protein n=1 Tax=Allacma fusca TaxID=39272 RepID=A0A8J2KND4_9HEXA|nr:unnamed protein product [Allacma fusca]
MQTLLAPYIPTDWEAECQLKAQVLDDSGSIVIYQFSMTSLLYFLAVVLTSVIVWITILCLASKRRSSNVINDSDYPGLDKGSYVKIP